MDIEHLVFEKGPKRVGPFSHAVKAGDFIFVTGQMPTLPDNPDVLVSNDVEEQTHQVVKNLGHFPMSENPKEFLKYLHPVLNQIS